MDGIRKDQVARITPEGRTPSERNIPIEAPVSIEVNGIAYAVMMASPSDLDAFARGFVLSETLATTADDIREVTISETDKGWIVRVWLMDQTAGLQAARIRVRLADSSCGICGIENLEQVSRALPPITTVLNVSDAAIFKALKGLRQLQPMNAATGGVHAAAFCTTDGEIIAAKEDVGRHNALDKLIGCLSVEKVDPSTGFILLSSRCSYELVEKAVIAGCPLLVTVSIATSMAVDRAQEAGLELIARARLDEMLGFTSTGVLSV